MLGTIVNAAAIALGGIFGLLLKKGLSEQIATVVMQGIGLGVLYIGFSGALVGENAMITIISLALGAAIGAALKLDDRLNHLGKQLEEKFGSADGSTTMAEAFVSASMLFCIGAMAITGSMESGLQGDHTTLFTKSIIDGICAMIIAASLGAGVMFSAVSVFIYQGSLTMLAIWVAPYLTTSIINEMSCVGSLLIVGIAFNMLKVTNLQLTNLLPAMFIPIILCQFM